MDQNSKSETLKLENQLCFPLYACARKVTNLYTPYLKDLGLTYTQYLVFLVLWDEGTMSVGDLCKKLYLDNGTITPLLKKMEKAGYVTRTRKQDDERVVMVSVTEDGLALREKALAIPDQVGNCLNMAKEEASSLYEILYRLLDQL